MKHEWRPEGAVPRCVKFCELGADWFEVAA